VGVKKKGKPRRLTCHDQSPHPESRPQPGRFRRAPPPTAARPPSAPPNAPPPAPPKAPPTRRSSPPRRLPCHSCSTALPRRRHRLQQHVAGQAAAAAATRSCGAGHRVDGTRGTFLLFFFCVCAGSESNSAEPRSGSIDRDEGSTTA
jgi:hypothetical protein